MKKSLALIAGAFVLFNISLIAGTVFEEIICRVNNDIITKSDYEKAKELVKRELQRKYSGEALTKAVAAQEKDLLKTLIDDQLIVQKALDLNLSADTEVINYLDRIRRENNVPTMEALDKLMMEQGIDPAEFKQNIKNFNLKQQVLGREVYYKLQSQISAEEVRDYYEEHKEEFDRPEQVRIQEILISTEGKEPAEVEALDKTAQEALQKARTGEKFEELAEKYSDGPTAKDGGDLGFFTRGQLIKDIEEVAFQLRRGQVSDIIKDKYGFHIIKVVEKHEAGIQRLETVTNEIRDRIMEKKAQPAVQDFLAKLRSRAFIEVKPGYVDSGAVAKATASSEAGDGSKQTSNEKREKKN